ncbi:MAG TPA: transcriptional regulator [Spirochaetaceae bacterium]|nr:transcriptional regulator [Spirochaetaceae bacterium]
MHDHYAEVSEAIKSRISDLMIGKMSDLYKIFGDCTRLRILSLLSFGKLCVRAICEVLEMNQSAVSHQLKILKDSRLVGNEKIGREVFYYLLDDHVCKIISLGREHVSEE